MRLCLIVNKALTFIIMEQNEEVVVDTENNEAEGEQSDTISLSKTEYDKLNQTLGSLKRELKDLKKPKETQETAKTNQPDDNRLLEKLERMSLRQAGITHQDDIELAKNTAKKWGVDIDEVLADDDFKVKLERQQNSRANVEATSNVRGSGSTSQAKFTPEYWIAKGQPPTATDISDRKARAKIIRAMMQNADTAGKKFYNE